jgi:hypothetical protein
MLLAQLVVGLQQGPGLQNVCWRDPALGQPALAQQFPLQPGIRPVGLGAAFRAAGGGGFGRIRQIRAAAGPDQFLGHIPPPGAALHRERHIPPARARVTGLVGFVVGLVTGQVCAQPRRPRRAIGRADLPTHHLTGDGVEIVEGDLLPVDIQATYDGHRDLLMLPNGQRP